MLLGRNVCIPFCFGHFFFPSLRHVNLWITSRTTNPARKPYMSSTRFPRILPCCEYAHVLINSTDCFPKQPPFLYSTTCPQPVWNCSLEQRPWVWNNKEGESHLEGGKWKHTWVASEVSTHGFVLKNYGWQGSYFSVSSKCTFSIPTTAKHERPPNEVLLQTAIGSAGHLCSKFAGTATLANASRWRAAGGTLLALERWQAKGWKVREPMSSCALLWATEILPN